MSPKKNEKMMRSFLAVDLTVSIREALNRLQDDLRHNQLPIRWVRPEGIHITLKFFGSIHPSLVARIESILAGLSGDQVSPFSMSLSEAGVFPNLNRPRVVWIGLDQGVEKLVAIQNKVQTELFRHLKVGKEKRKFRPHLTIGRVKKPCSVGPVITRINQEKSLFSASIPVTSMRLYESILRPTGAEYRVIQAFQFTGENKGELHGEDEK